MARVDVKVCLLGSSGVGKTCLLDRYINNSFEPSPKNTIGAAFAAKKAHVKGGKTITLGIWDTAGAEQFQSLSCMYYRQSRAAIVCFDPCSRASFEKLQFWVSELRSNEPQCQIHLVATKADLMGGNGSSSGDGSSGNGSGTQRRAVSTAAVQKYADSVGAAVYSTSAKTGQGVTALFQSIAESLAASLGDAAMATPRPPGLPLVSPHPRPGSPRSHSIVLSPDSSPPSRPGSTVKQSTCC